jgi:hypothetical protein
MAMSFQIPQHLRSCAYLSSTEEPAWSRQGALEVIAWATASQLAAFGIEIWLPTKPGPTIPAPYIYAFAMEQLDGETWDQFVRRANDAAADYVQAFEWDAADTQYHGSEPYFNLTLGEK